MNITLSRKEFKRLIELVYLGEQVAILADAENGAYLRRYEALAEKIYKHAAEDEDGCRDYVDEAEDAEGTFIPSFQLESESPAAMALEKFENNIFWEELVTRLAERDVEREQMRNPAAMSVGGPAMLEEQIMREEKLENRYRDEFVKNDLDNVFVLFGADRLS